ncbi:MAG: efflux RND transporter periplasmic adaptor subunit [Simkaniaceae bacterium]
MKKKLFVAGLAVFLCVAAVIVWILIKHYQGEENGQRSLTIYGNVDIRQVELGFRVFGRVGKLFYEEGDYVKEGQLLAELDPEPYLEEVQKAQANVDALRAAYKQAQKKWDRRNALSDPNAISREDYDDAFYTLKRLKGELEEAKAALAVAMTNLEDTKIFAPTAGSILSRIREPGSVVTIGEPVYALAIESPVWVRTYVSEPDLGLIYYGMKAEVYTDTKALPVYQGHIGFISPEAEFTPKNVETTHLRTDLVYRLRVIVDNPDHFLKQGMPVTVKLSVPHEQ